MRDKKKLAGTAALVAGAIIFMLWLAGLLHVGKIPPGVMAPKTSPAPGRVVVVQETAIPQELSVLGAVISPSLAHLSSQVPGRVSRIHVEAGSRVKGGDPLVTLTAAEFQARLNQAQAHLTQAAADYQRYQSLLKEGAVSPQEFGAMEARYKTAQAQVQEAAALKGYTVIRAPGAGVVAERRVAVGDLAQPGQPLISLYNPEMLQIEGEVNDSYRSAAPAGTLARVTVPAANWQADLPLTEIFPISQPGSRTFKVRTDFIKNSPLVPGMFARLELPLGETRGILIPQAAVRQVGQLSMVEVLTDAGPTRRQVKLGRQVGDRVEVLAGLQQGERIVLP